jgi:hypothetical protein
MYYTWQDQHSHDLVLIVRIYLENKQLYDIVIVNKDDGRD